MSDCLLHPWLICAAFQEVFWPPDRSTWPSMARAICRNVLVLLWQRHAVRGPVVAGVIDTVRECPALGVRTSQDVVLIAGRRRSPYTWNLVAFDIEGGRVLDIVAVALLVAMQIDPEVPSAPVVTCTAPSEGSYCDQVDSYVSNVH